MKTSAYRPDIDGLRALAVLLVVLFHLDVPILGGFIGVDVFFVISGFVVTRTLWPQIEAGTFRLRKFYINRFWRLQPSFFLVVLATLTASSFLMSPSSRALVAKSAASAAALSANVFFWYTSTAYESPAADQAPLLHMWSLGVEEQFYLLWPCLLLLFHRFKQSRATSGTCISLLLGAVAVSEWFAWVSPSAGYYLLPARLFELGLGAFLVRLEARKLPEKLAGLAGFIGLGLILGAAALLDTQSRFPGVHAAIPCFGTALLIQSLTTDSLLRRAFTLRPVQAVGRVSYAWYLWHWPGIAFAHYLEIPLSLAVQGALGLGSLGLAFASYSFWETPTRRSPSIGWKVATSALALSALCLSGVQISEEPALSASLSAPTQSIDYRDLACVFSAERFSELDACRKERRGVKPQKKRLLIWGDSHARSYREIIEAHEGELGFTPTTVDLGGCPPLFGVRREDSGKNSEHCQGQVALNVDRMLRRHKFDAILIVGRLDLYEKGWIRKGRLDRATHFLSDADTQSKDAPTSARVLYKHMKETVTYLAKEHDVPVIFALQTPTMPKRPEEDLKHRVSVKRSAFAAGREKILEVTKQFPSDVIIVDPIDVLCGPKVCPAWENGEALYRDNNHLSMKGLEKLLPPLKVALKQLK